MNLLIKLKLLNFGILCLLILAVTAGCSSPMVSISPTSSINAQKLGAVEGTSSGTLVAPLLGTAYYFLPMWLNGRMQSAYDRALAQAPGATALTNVTLKEDWYWIVIGTLRRVTITGEAVK